MWTCESVSMGTLNLFTSTHVFQVSRLRLFITLRLKGQSGDAGLVQRLSRVVSGSTRDVVTDAGPKAGAATASSPGRQRSVSPPLFTRSFINEVLKSNQPPHSSTQGTELGFGMRFFSSFASVIPSPSEKMGQI